MVIVVIGNRFISGVSVKWFLFLRARSPLLTTITTCVFWGFVVGGATVQSGDFHYPHFVTTSWYSAKTSATAGVLHDPHFRNTPCVAFCVRSAIWCRKKYLEGKYTANFAFWGILGLIYNAVFGVFCCDGAFYGKRNRWHVGLKVFLVQHFYNVYDGLLLQFFRRNIVLLRLRVQVFFFCAIRVILDI